MWSHAQFTHASVLQDEMTDLHKDLAELRISRETTGAGQIASADGNIDEYIEDSYMGDGSLLYQHHQQYSAAKPSCIGYPMNYSDPMYRHPQEPTVARLPGAHPVGGYFPQPMGYQSPMLRFPPLNAVSVGLPLPPPPPLYNHSQYMSPGNFGGHYPNSLPEHLSQSYAVNQSQNLPVPSMENVPSGVLTPMNGTPVPSDVSSIKAATPVTDTPSILSATKVPASSSSVAHPFQIAMPSSAVTLARSPFPNDTLGEHTTVAVSPTIVSGNDSANCSFNNSAPKSPDFKPIIPLPDEVQVVTGEENEQVQFAGQAKLYRLDENQWKERGVGIVKILLNRQTNKVRLVMRRDQVHRICANHQLVSGMSLVAKAGSKQAFMWSAQDYADEELKVETLCIRFGDVGLAVEFKKVFEECVMLYGKADVSPKKKAEAISKINVKQGDGFGDAFKPKSGSWNCDMCCVQNVADAVVCVACLTKRSSGQNASEPKDVAADITPATDTVMSKGSTLLDKLKGNSEDVAKPTGFNSSTPSFGSTSNMTSGFTFKIDGNKSGNDNQANAEFGGFSFSKAPQISPPMNNLDDKPRLKADSTPATSTSSPFAGFSFQSTSPAADAKSKTSATPTTLGNRNLNLSGLEYEPNVSFEPVVPLPDLIDKKSGEEDEEKVFGERAKLFRYDPEARQWKEKGVGEIKIIKHKTTHKYRVVMRRDQVFKLCANHYITATMRLLPMENSDKAWVWNAADFSEEQIKTEQLAIRFKTQEIAVQFKEHFDKCVSLVDSAAHSASSLTPKTGEMSFGDIFKPRHGSWECNACCVQNEADKVNCVACGTVKPGGTVHQNLETKSLFDAGGGFTFGLAQTTGSTPKSTFGNTNFERSTPQDGFTFGTGSVVPASSSTISMGPKADEKTFGDKFKPQPGSWECSACCILNGVDKLKCIACGTAKPGTTVDDTKKSDSDSSFGTAGGFTFGTSAQTGSNVKSIFGNDNFGNSTIQNGFKFGTESFTFGTSSAANDEATGKSFTFGALNATGNKDPSQMLTTVAASETADDSSKLDAMPCGNGKEDTDGKAADTSIDEAIANASSATEYTFGSPEGYKFNFGGVSPIRHTR